MQYFLINDINGKDLILKDDMKYLFTTVLLASSLCGYSFELEYNLSEYLVDELLLIDSLLSEKTLCETKPCDINDENFQYGYLIGKRDSCNEMYDFIKGFSKKNP